MNNIKVIKNFLTQEECDFYIQYIDANMEKFQQTKTSKRFIWLFGDELSMSNQSTIKLNLDLSILADAEGRVRKLLSDIEKTVKDSYKEEKSLYITSFSMTKQIPGAFITPHQDTDGGTNHYFKYSAILYLNTMMQDGVLEFPALGYSYSPRAGDFLMFPSSGIDSVHRVDKISEDRYSLPMWLTDDPLWKIR